MNPTCIFALLNIFTKIGSLLQPYRWQVVCNIFFNFISSLFGIISLSFVIPFLKLLFESEGGKSPNSPNTLATSYSDQLSAYFQNLIAGFEDKQSALLLICILVITVFFIKNIFYYLARVQLAVIRNGIVRDMRNSLMNKILRLSQDELTTQKKGDMLSRMSTDLVEIEWGVMGFLEALFKEPFNIFLLFSTLIIISPLLTMIVLIILPLTGILIARIAKSLKRDSDQAQEKQGYLISIVEEIISGMRIIRAFGAERAISTQFNYENQRYNDLVNRILWKKDLSSPMSEFFAIVAVSAVLYIGGSMVLGQRLMPAETFIFYIVIFSQVIAPVKALTTGWYHIQKGMASIERVDDMMSWAEAETQSSVALTLQVDKQPNEKWKTIELSNISFSYPGRKILDQISFSIQKGKKIALVGPSGSGKSTIIDLLLRLRYPESGTIRIDGQDHKDWSVEQWRSLYALVSQDPVLFHQSIYENITMGQTSYTEEQVMSAAKMAHAHEFILNQENQYKTVIGDRGLKLSGGERQRLTIARAILRDAPILLLDEATSALDAASEKLVQDAIDQAFVNKTVIMIAHRLSTVQKADEILYMREGIIIERGTHIQLMAIKGEYYRMVELQEFV